MAIVQDLHALATELHAQAGRYRSLAKRAGNPKVTELSLTMAWRLDQRAAEIEREILDNAVSRAA